MLWGTGISQLMFIIKPCAQLAPHHHPRADELLTLIQGAKLAPSIALCFAAVQGLPRNLSCLEITTRTSPIVCVSAPACELASAGLLLNLQHRGI